MIRVGILTVSSPVYWGERADECAPLLGEWLKSHLPGAQVELEAMVRQRRYMIQGTLMVWADEVGLDLIFILGGMEPAPEDIAVQAARAITQRIESLDSCVAGLRGHTLIVNLSDTPEDITPTLQSLSTFLEGRWS